MPNKIKGDGPSHTEHKPQHRNTHLRLVTRSHIARPKKQHTYVVAAFLAIFITTLTTIFLLNSKNVGPSMTLHNSFVALRSALTDDGLLKFQRDKGMLRDNVNKALKNSGNDVDNAIANNIAVFMFPELLSDEDFEKSVALDQWKPMQDAIERNPKSPESRVWFDEMRANIWNYESPDRENPKISEYAKEVLRIYDELSAP